MAEDRSLGELIREFVAVLGEYVTQSAERAVDRALGAPLRRAARKAVLLGLAFGFASMSAIALALGFFNLWLELFGGQKSLAYLVTFAICLVVGGLCAWVVFKDGSPPARGRRAGDGRGPGVGLARGPGEDSG